MTLPDWLETDIAMLPKNFTGQIVIECWEGGVTRRDFIDRRSAPKAQPVESKRHVLTV
jgi:hypothetical protein